MQPDQHAFHGLLHSADLVEGELRKHLAPLGVLPRQARVLEAIGRLGQVSQTDLAKAFGTSSASVSTMTDRLLAAGHITRSPDPSSRRQNVLALTDQGHALLGGISDAWTAVDKTIRAALGSDADTFFEQSRRLRDALGGTVPGESPALASN